MKTVYTEIGLSSDVTYMFEEIGVTITFGF